MGPPTDQSDCCICNDYILTGVIGSIAEFMEITQKMQGTHTCTYVLMYHPLYYNVHRHLPQPTELLDSLAIVLMPSMGNR